MSQTIISLGVIILAQLLPQLGVSVGSDELTTAITVIVTVGAAIWAWVRRVQAGGISVLGARK